MKAFNLVIVGVGGQGTLLASQILGRLAVKAGLDVKVSEVHGMSQRGGSVITYVRVGEDIHSPLVAQGEADILLAFEELEAVRALPYLKKGGLVVVNSQKILPMPVITGKEKYPEETLSLLGDVKTVDFDALKAARECGNQKALNIVMLGMLSRHLDFAEAAWKEALEACVPAKFLEVNLKAFETGRKAAAN